MPPPTNQQQKNMRETFACESQAGRAATMSKARNSMPDSPCHGEADSPETAAKPETNSFRNVWIAFVCIKGFIHINSFVLLQVVSPHKNNEGNNQTVGEKCTEGNTRRTPASQNNFWHTELAVFAYSPTKNNTYHTFHKTKQSPEHTTICSVKTPGEFLKLSDPPRPSHVLFPHKANDDVTLLLSRQTKITESRFLTEKATTTPAQQAEAC